MNSDRRGDFRDRERYGGYGNGDRPYGRYNNRDNGGEGRGGGGGRGYGGGFSDPNFGPYNNRNGYNRQNYRDGQRYPRGPRPYYNNREPFYDNRNDRNDRNEDDYEIQEEKEKALSEKEFEKKYSIFIDKIDGAFDGMVSKKDIGNIIKALIKMPSLTIFEAMNLIYRSIHIYRALNYYKSFTENTGAKLGSVDGDIFENKYHGEFSCDKLNEKIEKYKTEPKGVKSLDNSYDLYEDENYDKRRKLAKNIEGIYNYLPIKKDSIQMNEDDKKKLEGFDIFAKNENEINYHPLFFKTLMCHSCEKNEDENELINTDCPYCHDIQNDFRIIYDYKDNKICSLMNDLVLSELFTFVDYLEYIPKNIKIKDFHLKTFKIHKCQLNTDGKCPNDYHLCPYYHDSNKDKHKDIDGRRRPLWLFRYSSEMCEGCFDKKKKKYIAKNCPLGDFCNNAHNKNEYNYHIQNFRALYPCTRNPEGRCPYYITCYGIHNDEKEGNYSAEEEDENDDSINEENLEKDDDDIKEVKDKVKKFIMVGKNFRCRKCNELKPILNYFIDCKHFLCQNCFKKIISNFNKSKKKHKDEEEKDDKNILKCPFCDKELAKGKVLRCKFSLQK